MHAASVHPEPGSNSLKNGIYNSLAEATYRFLELAYLSFLLLFRVSKFVRDSFTRTFVFLPSWCSKYLLFNFQRPLTCSRLSCCKLVYYTSAVSVCQGLFKTFFAFFQSLSFLFRPRLSSMAAVTLPLGNAHLLYSRRFRLSSGFSSFLSICAICFRRRENALPDRQFDQSVRPPKPRPAVLRALPCSMWPHAASSLRKPAARNTKG